MPARSEPRIRTKDRLVRPSGVVGALSSAQSQSLREQARTHTRTCRSFGTGRATSRTSRTSGGPKRSRISAFIEGCFDDAIPLAIEEPVLLHSYAREDAISVASVPS